MFGKLFGGWRNVDNAANGAKNDDPDASYSVKMRRVCTYGRPDSLTALLEEGGEAITAAELKLGMALVAKYSQKEGSAMMRVLLDRGADPWVQVIDPRLNHKDWPALIFAVERARLDMVKLLVSLDGMRKAPAKAIDAALVAVALQDSSSFTSSGDFWQQDDELEVNGTQVDSSLSREASLKMIAMVLLQHGAAVTGATKSKLSSSWCPEGGMTPLQASTSSRNDAITQMLLKAGADPNILPPENLWADPRAATPLLHSIRQANVTAINLLLSRGCRPIPTEVIVAADELRTPSLTLFARHGEEMTRALEAVVILGEKHSLEPSQSYCEDCELLQLERELDDEPEPTDAELSCPCRGRSPMWGVSRGKESYIRLPKLMLGSVGNDVAEWLVV